jgi:hypothetical protein
MRSITLARSAGAIRGQCPWSKAALAAATARSTSAEHACGERPIGSSVVGEIVSKVSAPAGVTHSPPMNSRSRAAGLMP